MSYDIRLKNATSAETLHAESIHGINGGTQVLGGTAELWLNVTYNYAPIFYLVMGDKGIRTIYGMTGAASLPVLAHAIALLTPGTDPDYWKPTDGNARAALVGLLQFALMQPEGVWDGD